jgi:hypothetical protein
MDVLETWNFQETLSIQEIWRMGVAWMDVRCHIQI